MKQPLQRRLMLSLGAFTLGVSTLFGLFAMVFVYTVEDHFFEQLLEQEATRQHAHFALERRWGRTGSDFISEAVSFSNVTEQRVKRWPI